MLDFHDVAVRLSQTEGNYYNIQLRPIKPDKDFSGPANLVINTVLSQTTPHVT